MEKNNNLNQKSSHNSDNTFVNDLVNNAFSSPEVTVHDQDSQIKPVADDVVDNLSTADRESAQKLASQIDPTKRDRKSVV